MVPTPLEIMKFRNLVKVWKKDTKISSILSDMVNHWAYQEIISMGIIVVPMLLEELIQSPDHWFCALSQIIGEDPARRAKDFDQVVEAWLAWGKARGYLPKFEPAES